MFENRFDQEARDYDDRAHMPEAVCRATADGLLALAGLGAGDLTVEVGVGTGQISRWLGPGVGRFIGIDKSKAMLDLCAAKLPRGAQALLVQADCQGRWPVASHSAGLIFGSRSLHLISADHVVAEVGRVMRRSGGVFVIGRVKRPEGSIETVLKRQMHHMVRSGGHVVTEGGRATKDVLDALTARGAARLATVETGQWSVHLTPRAVLAHWADRAGLAGCDVPTGEKQALLASLAAWAGARFGGLDQGQACLRAYTLDGVRLREG